MPDKGKNSYSIQSVDNALAVLEALCAEGEEVKVSSLSERLGMNRISLFRYLATFESRGYVEKNQGNGSYRLGLTAYETGRKLLSRMTLLQKAKPVIEKLARDCNEAVYLAIPRGAEILMLDMVDTAQQIKIIPLLGNRYPMATTSAGRTMLANSTSHCSNCPEAEISRLQARLEVIRSRGCDFDHGNFGEGIASASAPLVDASGNIPGSICLIAPEFRLGREHFEQVIMPQLTRAADIVSSKLGNVENLLKRKLQSQDYLL